MILNVRDYSSPAATFTAARDGDRVYFPGDGAAPFTAPAGGWQITKSLEVFGDGVGKASDDTGSTIKPASANDHAFVVVAPIQNVHFHDFKIKLDTQPGSDGTGNGIHCLTTTGNKATEITVERVTVLNLGNDAFHFEGANAGDAAVIFLRLRDCEAATCRGSGFYIKNCVATYALGGYLNGNRRFGAYCETSGQPRFIATVFENNQAAGTSASFDSQLRLKGCHAFTVLGCHFESFANNSQAMTAITVEFCAGGMVGSTVFYLGAGVAGSRGIFIVSTSRAILVNPNNWSLVDKIVEVNASDNNTDCVILPQFPTTDANSAGTISLPDQDGNGNFAFVPTTKTSNIGAGILLPRITTTTRDNIPAGILQRGVVVYNSTTNKLNFYDGTAWRAVTST